MDLVIDKANFISLLSDHQNIKECNSLIQKGINLILNFCKDDLTEDEKEKIVDWQKDFNDGRKNFSITWKKLFESENLKTNFLNTELQDEVNTYKYAFLLNNDRIVDYVKKKGGTLIGKLGEESKLILSMRLEGLETFTHEIRSWKDYCPLMPLTDIIICDNHYFKNKKVYENNSNELIEALCRVPNQTPVNCVIIVKRDDVDPSIDLEEEQRKIQRLVKKITNSQQSNVAIILTYATHDRHVITNYYRINNGSCFHIKGNGLKDNVLTDIKSHAIRNSENISEGLIARYKKIVQRAQEKKDKKNENNYEPIYGIVQSKFF